VSVAMKKGLSSKVLIAVVLQLRGHIPATLHRIGGEPIRDPMPKTKSSRRALPLPALVAEALKAHRSSQAVERMATRAWTDPTLVFTTGVGTAIEPKNCLRAFQPCVIKPA